MIRAFIFDLDGTLVKTELLKARSYAQAVAELCPDPPTEEGILDAFKEVVGLSRREAAQGLIKAFGLEECLEGRMSSLGVSTAWQAFVQVRMRIFRLMLQDPVVLRSHIWPDSLELLKWARQNRYKTGLATNSGCVEANHVLQILDIRSHFDFIATLDDITNGKPDPEIYHLVAHELRMSPEECVAIEDSTPGIRAALGAGMWCIAIATQFTRDNVHKSGLLDERWIVDDPTKIKSVARAFIEEKEATARKTI
jgi:HAD superfamily hydrolase (TIGR01509 family)